MPSRATHTVLPLLACLLGGLLVTLTPTPAVADHDDRRLPTSPPLLVSERVATGTPSVLDGRVYSVVQVGRTIVLGGTFTRVREAGRSTVLRRRGLVAFDAFTGRVNRRFAPDPRGDVRVVLPGPDGHSVYVGGAFRAIGQTRRARLAMVRVRDGSVVRRFRPGPVTGEVKDLALARGRLWVAGAFTHVDGHPQRALATVGPRTGRWSPFMGLTMRGHHHRGVTQVLKISAPRDGSRLVAIGNFDRVAGARNHQLVVLDLRGRRAVLGGLRTSFYTSSCSQRFDTFMRDVDVSPDGRYFVVGTTGSYGGVSTSCDTVARFELGAAGSDVAPSWVDHSGGDTTYSVEATPAAVYVGGHQRWWNNPFGRNRAGDGAVARSGIAALDPVNGLPLDWDPGRDRGVGVFDFLSTPAGLWVASDTTRIAGQHRDRIARLLPHGSAVPTVPPPVLPGEVYLGGPTDAAPADGGSLRRRAFTGGAAGVTEPAPDGGLDWSTVRGAFDVTGRLYLAHVDGRFTVRCFDGTHYGPAVEVTASDQLSALRGWADDVRRSSGMFFDQGRIYYTLAGSDRLFYRYFSPHSGVVGAQRLVASGSLPGVDLSRVRGMFLASDTLFWASDDGVLRSVGWRRRSPSGAPDGALGATWPGDAGTGGDWGSRGLFVLQPGAACEPPG